MPSGRTHDRITLWTLPWVTLGTWFLTQASDAAIAVGGAFLFSGLMFGPDLDINSRQFQRWGCLRGLWIPYQKMLRHRSIWSHGLILGTMGRCLYLGFWLTIIVLPGLALAAFLGIPGWRSTITAISQHLLVIFGHKLCFSLLIGLELGAMSHSLSDWIGSAYKKRQRLRSRPIKSKKRS
ncbi:metal-binding protein [Merismopedia glauca]|uniref:Metal-binding protein n=1 Tax=Merismopedia glauca CCAP 1448/3 TaxID=1296344 RepID=A0A2T1BXX7_9CYAN|nr:metal-binding protein [Merismopedia glauca]PSB00784.1 metal-binding protein [Merismopedia glauca CCAP 1448/3]